MSAPEEIRIARAGLGDVDLVAPLFDLYRQFYEQAPDAKGARRFIGQRVSDGDSVIFLALSGFGPRAKGAGFTQLYPSYSSVAMKRVWILNDLFVAEEFRRAGVARRLLEKAADFGKETGAVRLVLSTALENAPARGLYEKLGWVLDRKFGHYGLKV